MSTIPRHSELGEFQIFMLFARQSILPCQLSTVLLLYHSARNQLRLLEDSGGYLHGPVWGTTLIRNAAIY